jgi:hypothetical protein
MFLFRAVFLAFSEVNILAPIMLVSVFVMFAHVHFSVVFSIVRIADFRTCHFGVVFWRRGNDLERVMGNFREIIKQHQLTGKLQWRHEIGLGWHVHSGENRVFINIRPETYSDI